MLRRKSQQKALPDASRFSVGQKKSMMETLKDKITQLRPNIAPDDEESSESDWSD